MSQCPSIEAKRRQNVEDNRRFLAELKINHIRDEIKEITNEHPDRRRAAKKDDKSDKIRRGSRIRKNLVPIENIAPAEARRTKKTDENRIGKIKLQLPEHMLTRYQSTGKRVALHNTKATFGDDDDDDDQEGAMTEKRSY